MGVDDTPAGRSARDLFVEAGQPLILEASTGVVELASELAAAGISVIYEPGGQRPRATQSFSFGGFRGVRHVGPAQGTPTGTAAPWATTRTRRPPPG